MLITLSYIFLTLIIIYLIIGIIRVCFSPFRTLLDLIIELFLLDLMSEFVEWIIGKIIDFLIED